MSDWRPADWLAMMVIVPNLIAFAYICVRIGWIKRREIMRFLDEMARPFDDVIRALQKDFEFLASVIERCLRKSTRARTELRPGEKGNHRLSSV